MAASKKRDLTGARQQQRLWLKRLVSTLDLDSQGSHPPGTSIQDVF